MVAVYQAMRPARYLLLLLLANWAMARADEPAMAPLKLSDHLSGAIRASLPKYRPHVPRVVSPDTSAVAAKSDDPAVLVLPKMVVKEPRLPGNDHDVWLTDRTIRQKAMAAYHGSMSPLEWVLNSWYIPLFSAPPSARAHHYYEQGKITAELDRLHNLARVISLSDPPAAAKIRRAMDFK